MLGAAAQQFVERPGRSVQANALMSLAFGDFLHPHEHPGPDALRAAVTAPDPAGDHGDKEQAKGGNHQNRREQDEVLRPESRTEDMELLAVQVPEHCLMTVPVDPGGTEEQQHQCTGSEQAQVAVQTLETAGMNGAALLGGRQVFQGNMAGHGIRALGFSGCGDDAGIAASVTDSDSMQKTISDGCLVPLAGAECLPSLRMHDA